MCNNQNHSNKLIISRSTLVPIGVVVTILVAVISMTTAWATTSVHVERNTRDLHNLEQKLDKTNSNLQIVNQNIVELQTLLRRLN